MPLTMNPPPLTPVDPATEFLHGISVIDLYRWLEDQNSTRTRRWLEEQTRYARTYLDSIPGRDRIRRRVEELLAVEVISQLWKVGEHYFYAKRTATSQQPVIMMGHCQTGEEITLVDPTQRDETGTTAVNILTISSEGNLIAYGVRRGGEDSCVVEFFDIRKRVRLPDHLARGFCRGLALTADGSGFYYSH